MQKVIEEFNQHLKIIKNIIKLSSKNLLAIILIPERSVLISIINDCEYNRILDRKEY